MSEQHTRDLPDSRSFEERVFARFDALDVRFNTLETRFDTLETRFDTLETRFDNLESRFDAVDGRLDGVDARVHALEIQSEKRTLETRPIWERALAEILEVKQGVEDLGRKINLLNREILQVRADQLRVEDRMDKLDSSPA